MTLQEIIKLGTAPNPLNNTTIAAAKRMEAAIAPFLTVVATLINTTIAWPAESAMIPIAGLDIPEDVPLYLHVQVYGAGRHVEFGVANWLRIVESSGMHDAVILCLATANPDWALDKELADKVAALPGVPPPVVIPDQPVAAMPDWDNPRTEGVLGSRPGDHSPMGTVYTSPSAAKWIKGQWLSMFETTWKRG